MPSHGPVGNAALIATCREFMTVIRSRTAELIAAAARAAYAEAP